MPAESSLAICSMIFGGVFERYPKLKVGVRCERGFVGKDKGTNSARMVQVAFAHCGGAFPGALLQRIVERRRSIVVNRRSIVINRRSSSSSSRVVAQAQSAASSTAGAVDPTSRRTESRETAGRRSDPTAHAPTQNRQSKESARVLGKILA